MRFIPKASALRSGVGISFVVFCFLAVTLPLAFERVAGGRSAERQGYTAGIIRIYCQEPTHSVFKGPQIHFGRNPFNLEFTGFEWAQGVLARAFGGPQCDSNVEEVGKLFSIICSALAILGVALLGTQCWGALAGFFSAILLATDELWLRYATYTMIENRVLACGVWAIYFSLRRRKGLATIFWALTFLQKPQIFVLCSVFWLVRELTQFGNLKDLFKQRKFREVCLGYWCAAFVGLAWYFWSSKLNQNSDLPWIIHTGPRAQKWYFGTWDERLSWNYFKGFLLTAVRDSGLNVALPVAAGVGLFTRKAPNFRVPFFRALPFAAALFAYTFIFYHVFVVHEYYALPLDVMRALTTAGLMAYLIDLIKNGDSQEIPKKILQYAVFLSVAIVVGRAAIVGLKEYSKFALNINNPDTSFYHTEWNRQIFPDSSGLVVIAPPPPATGRDLLFLYLSKQRGFVWCSVNEKFAPRAYWKEQGVKYIAWGRGINPQTHHYDWEVRTLEEELNLSRKNGWSSDLSDVWAGRSMPEWANLASRSGHDPCISDDDFDPRTWADRPGHNTVR